MSKNVLVTGGAGYIGSHTCKELSRNGFTPIVFDDLSTGHEEFIKWGPLFIGNVKSKRDLRKVFDEYDIKLVIHFAAKANIKESTINPIKYFKENIYGTTNLLNQFLASNGEVLIFSSSCSVYGEQNADKISENTTQNPINPYGFSKLASEKLINYLKFSNNFNFSILRYFNVAGADASLEIGELHQNESHVVPLLIMALLKNETFLVNGKDFDTLDGTAIRDYVHVSDVAKAHVLALQYNISEKKDITCNLGSGRGISVLELINEIKKINPDFLYDFREKRQGDPSKLIADIEIAKDVLHWEPKQSNVSDIINSSLAWHKNILS
jgi:UDP-glucose-4-epimerase GalE